MTDLSGAGAQVARPSPGSSWVNRWVQALGRDATPTPARILALGAEAAALAPALRARRLDVVDAQADSAEAVLSRIASTSPGSLDLVLALGCIEWLRWDRWALRQIHRTLAEGGVLVLSVPNLYSLRSLADPRYVAAKLAKRLPGLRPVSGAARSRPRTYTARRLGAMLEEIGYEPGHAEGIEAPSSGPAAWLSPRIRMVVRKARRTTTAPRVAPAALRRFEAEHQVFLAQREEWRRRLDPPAITPRPLDPARYAGSNVLVLSPHPDDEIIGCGGTLLRLVQAGARVTVLQATDGSASAALEDAPPAARRTIRLEEAHAVAEAAGFEPTIFWREDNGAFHAREDLVAKLRDTLRQLEPALVFTPFLADVHADHQTLNRILAPALDGLPAATPGIVCYEVWSLAPANLWCDVTSCMQKLEKLLLLYETAMKVDDFVHMCSTRNRYHAQAFLGGQGFAEAFFVTEASRFRALVC